ncbi:cytochrome c3 family protein [Ferrimonas sp. YFM]|uniref:cytochrome c3 family protein n=1 Tax=Ferrimonas sp. YFM TaxID=3028878 RepID=UPI00257337EF|nr:cytochrome c3 family protein [Ferrimonas sp. YFM]
MMKKLMTLAAVAAVLASTNVAAEIKADASLTDQGMMDGRSYHQKFYKKDNCKVCHGTNAPSHRPADDACLKCHKADKLAKKTARKGDELWQNPHNNLHYGKEVPCTVCHGEHEAKQPLCNDCHTFKFTKHKQ